MQRLIEENKDDSPSDKDLLSLDDSLTTNDLLYPRLTKKQAGTYQQALRFHQELNRNQTEVKSSEFDFPYAQLSNFDSGDSKRNVLNSLADDPQHVALSVEKTAPKLLTVPELIKAKIAEVDSAISIIQKRKYKTLAKRTMLPFSLLACSIILFGVAGQKRSICSDYDGSSSDCGNNEVLCGVFLLLSNIIGSIVWYDCHPSTPRLKDLSLEDFSKVSRLFRQLGITPWPESDLSEIIEILRARKKDIESFYKEKTAWKVAFLMGNHRTYGKNSSVSTLFTNPISDLKNLTNTIFEFAAELPDAKDPYPTNNEILKIRLIDMR